jgi:hypothetical protein
VPNTLVQFVPWNLEFDALNLDLNLRAIPFCKIDPPLIFKSQKYNKIPSSCMGFAKVLFTDVWIFLRSLFQMYWFYKRKYFSFSGSDSIIAESLDVIIMKKKKNEEDQISDSTKVLFDTHQKESDEAILENITMRKEENQALKKLLDNLNSTLANNKA